MRLAVTSTVILDVPDDRPSGRTSLTEIREQIYRAHVSVIGNPMVNVAGLPYTIVAIRSLDVRVDTT